MQQKVAVDNPLCPLGEKEIVTKIANGTPIPDDATNGDIIKALFPNDSRGFLVVNMDRNDWWNALYKKGTEE